MLANPEGFRRRHGMLIDRVKHYADVLLIAPFEQAPPRRANHERRDPRMQTRYRAVTREVAATYGCALLDLYEEWGALAGVGFEAANAHGLMHDGLHPSQAGHDDIAARVAAILGVVGRLPDHAKPTR
jgi:lysophospholipase L1-like esterase